MYIVNFQFIRQIPAFFIQSAQLCDKKTPINEDKSENVQKKETDEKHGSAADRLNKLLASMKTDENDILLKSVEIPKAGGRKKAKSEDQNKVEKIKREQKSKDILEAAKDVANLMGEDKKKIESELLAKLLNHTDSDSQTGSEKPNDLK